MNKNPLQALSDEMKQSVWYDNIQRAMLQDGTLAQMITGDGLRGMTSNPAIFEKAISGSTDYEASIAQLIQSGQARSGHEAFYHLAIDDIRMAADLFRPVFEATDGEDGHVSLEVSPTLARDTESTIKEALELRQRVARDNLMIKVPATKEGLPAIEALTAAGVNINATLLFSVERYKEVLEAYLRGLETRARQGQDISGISSVASFFVSRVDNSIDKLLEQHASEQAKSLLGKSAVANAKVAYQHYKTINDSPRCTELRAKGAKIQRLLWASTGVKNPNYSDVLYIEELIGPHTVSTIPPATYDAFRDHGKVRDSLEENVDQAHALLAALPEFGIDIKAVTDELEDQGVQLFADAFNKLLSAIDAKLDAKRVSNA